MMRRLFEALSGALLVFALVPGATAEQVVEHRLENGLTVLVQQDSRAPVVTHQVWYRVGSMDEHSGITGISHMLEHMMFKGSEQYPPGEFSRIVSRLGGRENAFTGRDYTGYFQVLGNEHWEKVMAMEAERMHALQLTEEEFRPERRVVIEERRLRTEDRPNSLLHEQFMATAFFNHPYGHPIIGWMTDIDAYTLDDLQAWYDSWYAPNNAVVVVVGDVDPDAVIAAAERHFGDIPARELPARKPRIETPQRGERRVTLQAPAELPYLLMGWKTPVLKTLDDPADAYALIVAAGVLDSGDASRFARGLVRGREIASSTSARYSAFSRLDSLFTVAAVPAGGTDIDALEAALLAEIERLKEEPIEDSELQRVQARVIASEIFQKDSIRAQAFELGMLQTVGLGWQVAEEYVDRIRAVTAEDVQRVAREYLVPERRTVGVLDPLPIGGEA
ncbi:M16 family metallopeptidase [Thioalkalivibrio paradoxus]|uniref:Peptidase M16 n=1 Tax=Thioalkalivibrio paradoxus ARh 1 TaxID=713585 RepID=W0DRK5_9GAMM|nr:pitrilysin family protein [Thioalkalivibrio paradoxus]AHE99618.1 peptidase M16 [Thioalkalivibrio paradoxus ARh 1]